MSNRRRQCNISEEQLSLIIRLSEQNTKKNKSAQFDGNKPLYHLRCYSSF